MLRELFSKLKNDVAINFSDRDCYGDEGSLALDNTNLQTSDSNLVPWKVCLFFPRSTLLKEPIQWADPPHQEPPPPLYFYDNIYKMSVL